MNTNVARYNYYESSNTNYCSDLRSNRSLKNRRMNELKALNRVHRLRAIIIGAAIIMLICISSMIIVKASDQINNKQMNRYYTSITIETDDTLWDIANKYNTGSENTTQYINKIKQMNNMTSDTLYKGENLLVYYYSSEVK